LKVSKKRHRIHANGYYEKEQMAPFRAPKWTIDGYRGSLKDAVQTACSNRQSNTDNTDTQPSGSDTQPPNPPNTQS